MALRSTASSIVGVQYDTHGAPFSDYRPAASANIVQKNSRQSVVGLTPSNMGQSRIGLQGIEPLAGDWSAVFQAETFFNPQSGQIANSLKSLAVNNGRTPATSGTNLDGSSAGQACRPPMPGFKSPQFGTITFGRQLTLLRRASSNTTPTTRRRRSACSAPRVRIRAAAAPKINASIRP
jgi:predicted porin